MRHSRPHGEQGDVELNMAAMLDMAFQLLAFFILTFNPQTEPQIALHLAPPQLPDSKNQGSKDLPPLGLKPDKLPTSLKTLVITVFPDDNGDIASFGIGESSLPGDLRVLDDRLRQIFRDPANLFEQVILQVSQTQRYDALMKVIGVCAEQRFDDGRKLSKLSFVEVPNG